MDTGLSGPSGPSPVHCADCNAALQEAPTERPGSEIWRCPWVSGSHRRVEFKDDELLVLHCDWPRPKPPSKTPWLA